MNFLPYQKLVYKSSLTKDQAIIKLAQSIDSNPPLLNWKFGKLQKPFKGSLVDGQFRLSNVVNESAGGFPYIEGQILHNEKGCTIDITIKLRLYHLVILLLGFTVILVFFLYITLSTHFPHMDWHWNAIRWYLVFLYC